MALFDSMNRGCAQSPNKDDERPEGEERDWKSVEHSGKNTHSLDGWLGHDTWNE